MFDQHRADPYGAYRFLVEIDGMVAGGFTDVSGLEAKTEIESFREGGFNFYEHKFIKHTTFSDLTLTRGMSDVNSLWRWYSMVATGRVFRKNLSILLVNENGSEVQQRWDYLMAFPISWSGPTLNASQAVVATEKVVITHQGMILSS